MNRMQGAASLAVWNMSRTRLAPTPTNIWMNSEPLIEKNGTPASPATARASSVLPVPGGPISSTPLGTRPPSRWNFFGFLQKLDDLLQVVLDAFQAGHVVERHRLAAMPSYRLAGLLLKPDRMPPPIIWICWRRSQIQKSTNRPIDSVVTAWRDHQRGVDLHGVVVLAPLGCQGLAQLRDCSFDPAGSCDHEVLLGPLRFERSPSGLVPGLALACITDGWHRRQMAGL